MRRLAPALPYRWIGSVSLATALRRAGESGLRRWLGGPALQRGDGCEPAVGRRDAVTTLPSPARHPREGASPGASVAFDAPGLSIQLL